MDAYGWNRNQGRDQRFILLFPRADTALHEKNLKIMRHIRFICFHGSDCEHAIVGGMPSGRVPFGSVSNIRDVAGVVAPREKDIAKTPLRFVLKRKETNPPLRLQ